LKYTVEGIPDVEGNINIGGVGVKQSWDGMASNLRPTSATPPYLGGPWGSIRLLTGSRCAWARAARWAVEKYVGTWWRQRWRHTWIWDGLWHFQWRSASIYGRCRWGYRPHLLL